MYRIFNFIVFVSTTYLSTVWINFYYLSSRNVDFHKYYGYINYFLGADVDIDYGQGSLYFYLITFSFKNKLEIINENNFETIINYSVQNINLLLYIIGLIGVYKLLKFFEFSNSLIFLTLSIFNFFPQGLFMRAVMKPEILGFSFLPWIIYFLEQFKKTNSKKYIFRALPFLVLVLSSKASIAGMILFYILIIYRGLIPKIIDKKYISIFLVFIISFSLIQIENYQITDNHIFERKYDRDYDNKAKFDVLYNFNIRDVFFTNEEKKFSDNSDSILQIAIRDSFGDHFEQFFNTDLNYFDRHRKDLFTSSGEPYKLSDDRRITYVGPYSSVLEKSLDDVRRKFSSLFSVIFFTLLLLLIATDSKYRKFYTLPFFGLFVLFLNSLGFPSNNFNPQLGDTFKSFYYSFFLCLSFIFLIVKIFSGRKKIIYVFLIIWVTSIFFIGGHPKENSQYLSEYLVAANSESIFCSINNIIFFENDIIKSFHHSGNINNKKSKCFSELSENYQNLNKSDDPDFKGDCFKDNQIINESANSDICRVVIIHSLLFNGIDIIPQIPLISVFTFVALIFIVVFYIYLGISKYISMFTKLRN